MLKRNEADGGAKGLAANIAWNTAGKLMYAASRAVILLLLAKLGSAAMVGQYALAFAVTAPVFLLTDLDLRSILSTTTDRRNDFQNFLGLRLISSCAALLVVAVIALMQKPEARAVIFLVGLAKGIESISDMIYGLLQKNERLDKVGISLMIKSVLSVVAISLPLLLAHSLVIGALGMAVAFLILLMVYDIPAARAYTGLRLRLEPRQLLALARLSLPLGLVLMFSSVIKNLSNYFIEAFHGSASLGYFSAMVYIMVTGSLVVSALSQSASARLARLHAQGDRGGFRKLYARMVLLVSLLGAGMLFVAAVGGRQILSLLYQPDYAVWSQVFIVIIGAAAFSYVSEITAAALTAMHAFVIQPIVSGAVLLAGLAANALLVPRMGLTGAAICLVISSALQMALNAAVLLTRLRAPAAAEAGGVTVRPMRLCTADNAWFLTQWKELLDKSGSDQVFAQPDLLLCWWNTVGAREKSAEPLILAVYRAEALVAVFPLVLVRRLGIRRICFMGAPQATHTVVACLPEHAAEAASALVGYVLGMKPGGLLSLGGFPRESALYRALEAKLRQMRRPLLATAAPSPYIAAYGLTYEALFADAFSPHAAKNARRDDKRLRALGRVSCRELTADDMAAAFALHDKRWSRKIDTSGFTVQSSRDFFTSLLRREHSERWEALAIGLFVDERLLAFQYGFLCKGRALLYKSAHDDDFGIYAPGKMLKRHYIERCVSRGIGVVDLGVGYEEYKQEWTQRQDEIMELSFAGKGLVSSALFCAHSLTAGGKAAAKRSRKLVLFRRNTLGRVRYALSPGRLASGLRAGSQRIKRRITRYAPGAQRQTPAGGAPCTIRKACVQDIDGIAAMMDCPAQDVAKRLYRLQQCYVAQTDGGLCCAMWVAQEGPEEAVICGLAADQSLCRSGHIACLLEGVLAQLKAEGIPRVTTRIDDKRGGFLLPLVGQSGIKIAERDDSFVY